MDHPNIIFIFSDQQRYSSVGCHGNEAVKTPNLDALGAGGVIFDNAFSSCPICAPYRGQIMTGKYSHANGCIDNEYALFPGQPTLASALKDAGYATAYIGKWHLGYGPYTPEKRYGFDYMAANNCNHRHWKMDCYENEAGPIPIDGWGPTGQTDQALQYIRDHRQRSTETPFCLLMSWSPPHWSYVDYPDQYDIYDAETVDLPPNVPEEMAAFARKELADYYGNVTGLDHEMGRVMAFLKENGLEENTILCYSSDHGDHLSSHGYGKPMSKWLHHTKRASKATPHEESIHIPFLLRYPAKAPSDRRTEIMFSSVDVMPTLLGLAGVEPPDGIQGADLSHAALGTDGPEPDSVYLQILGPGWPHRGDWVGFWRGVRTPRWVYARWFGSSDIWLYDRENDPYEMRNLAGDPEYKAIQNQMEQRLQQWIEETEDPFETGERDPETGILLLGQRFIHEKYEGELWRTGRKSVQQL